jgi:hypothetical protein
MSRTSRTTTTVITYPDDSPAMQAALRWLTQAGLRFARPTRYQLKIGPLSFYPDKGTLYRDGDRQALPERGLPALQALLGNHPQPCPIRRTVRTRPHEPDHDDRLGHDRREPGPRDLYLKD